MEISYVHKLLHLLLLHAPLQLTLLVGRESGTRLVLRVYISVAIAYESIIFVNVGFVKACL
jgi:hypothetical protein